MVLASICYRKDSGKLLTPVLTPTNPEPASTPSGATVHLIQATRVPAQHSKMIHAKIDVNGRKSDEVFLLFVWWQRDDGARVKWVKMDSPNKDFYTVFHSL